MDSNFKDIIVTEFTKTALQIVTKFKSDEKFTKELLSGVDFASIALSGYKELKDRGVLEKVLQSIHNIMTENETEIKKKLTSDDNLLKDMITKGIAKLTSYDDKIIEGIKSTLKIELIDELVNKTIGNKEFRGEFNQKITALLLEQIRSF